LAEISEELQCLNRRSGECDEESRRYVGQALEYDGCYWPIKWVTQLRHNDPIRNAI